LAGRNAELAGRAASFRRIGAAAALHNASASETRPRSFFAMPQTINTNLNSLTAQRNLNTSQASLATSMQRLSSGLRVNSAKDDAAGLAIAERMNTQVRGMNVAIRNANDGISLAQTAEGAMGAVSDALQRMRELAVQARNASNSDRDKDSLDKEFGELAKEIQRVLGGTSFNGKHMLGVDAGTQTFQVGANTTSDDTIDIATTNMTVAGEITTVAGTDNTGSGRARIDSTSDSSAIGTVIGDIDKALDKINSERATLGAAQSRFDAVIANLQVAAENQTAARSRIMDADFAAETANLSRAQILQQAGTAMVAQANQLPQQVLRLLQG
jgi:flagellin